MVTQAESDAFRSEHSMLNSPVDFKKYGFDEGDFYGQKCSGETRIMDACIGCGCPVGRAYGSTTDAPPEWTCCSSCAFESGGDRGEFLL